VSLISVILPFRNAEETLEAAVESILKQTMTEFELILINDHSSDSSKKIAQSIPDERIILLDNKKTGLVEALNLALNQARGNYIARMDADDYSHPKRFAVQLEHLKALPENFVSSCQVNYISHFPKDSNTSGYQYYVNWLNALTSAEDHYVNRFVDAPIAHPTLFCRKETFDKYGLYANNGYPEDFELWLRWMDQGVHFEKVSYPLYDWHDYPERISRNHPSYASAKFEAIKAKYFGRWFGKKSKELWVIGYGRDVFQRSALLLKHNLRIKGYVDIKARSNSSRLVISYEDVERSDDKLFLIYVRDRKGKKLIGEFLKKKNMEANRDYLFMA
jgi:glycosyltransferase involved in cell wall biosynthesis